MRYRLRSLMIVLAVGPPALAAIWWMCATELGRSWLPTAILVLVGSIVAWISMAPERRFRREVASRAPLDEAEFIRQFYADGSVPADIVVRLRPIYCRYFDIEIGKLRPTDRPPEIVELDTVELVRKIEREFSLTIPDRDAENIDGSFDSIVRYLAQHQATSEGSAKL